MPTDQKPRFLVVAALVMWCTPLTAQADGNAPDLAPLFVDPGWPAAQQARIAGLKQEALRRRPRARREAGWEHLSTNATSDVEFTSRTGTLKLNPQTGKVECEAVLLLTSQVTKLQKVQLLFDELWPQTIEVRDRTGLLALTNLGGGVREAALRQPLSKGQTIALTVRHSGTWSQSGQYSVLDPALTFSQSAWMPAPLDPETGYFLPAGKTSLAVTVPEAMSVAVDGLSTGINSNGDGTRTFGFRIDWKAFLLLAAAPYVVGSTSFAGGAKTATTHLLAGNAPQGAAWRQATADIVEFHGERYGAYSLPMIDVAEIPDITGGLGMLSTVFLSHLALSGDPATWYGRYYLAHELAHQWFGGFIYLGDRSSPWLNEGFATFGEMEYTIAAASKELGADYGPLYREHNALTYLYGVAPMADVPLSSDAISDASEDVYFAVTYFKGALVVNTLRQLLGGNAPFLAALRKYREDHVTEPTTLTSMVSSISQATGKDLSCFVEQWVESAGYPTFTVEVQRSAAGTAPSVTIQVVADKDPCLPLTVGLFLANGKVERRQLTLSGLKQTATYQLPAEVVQVELDPDVQMMRRVRSSLAGDIVTDGEVDGMDLVAIIRGQGQAIDQGERGFSEWMDLSINGVIDQRDLDVVLGSFGQSAKHGG